MKPFPWAPFVIFLLFSVMIVVGCQSGGSGTQPPVLSVAQSTATFNSAFGGSNPAPVTINLTNTGGGTLMFSASSDSPWLSVTPGNGTAPQSLQLSAGLGTLTTASYTGHITITANGAQGSPATITATFNIGAPAPSNAPTWAQWGANPQHTGMVNVVGQQTAHQLADIIYDKFAPQEEAEEAAVVGAPLLLVHYQAPLIDGNDVYMMTKSGSYPSCSPVGAWQNGAQCGPNTWSAMIWNESRFTWENGKLAHIWDFASDWKPAPDDFTQGPVGTVEPVFHPADANHFIYVPGAGGTIWKINKADGTSVKQINPFGNAGIIASNTYVFSPLSADASGNIYYNVIQFADPSVGPPWQTDPVNSWLVQVTPQDTSSIVLYATLTPNAPGANANCEASYSVAFDPSTALPWPPANFPPVPTQRCGPQRPAINLAPAIAPDGTIYTASRAHEDAGFESFLIAVNPDLTPKWAASLQHLLSDGCGVIVPINDSTNSNVNYCRFGTTLGVDLDTNANGSGILRDTESSSPTVLPDGSIIFGVQSLYPDGRGHLLHFDALGNYLNEFDYGHDSTPGVYTRPDGTFSVVIKDNHYGGPLDCRGNPGCQGTPQIYYITQVNPAKPDPTIAGKMLTEWSFQSTNTESCTRNPDGSLSCTSDHPYGFEWCINMPAIDTNGTVYVNSEDGNIYAIPQGQSGVFTVPMGNLFLNLALGAAYTPLAIGPDGKLYTQNNGHMFVVGN